MMRMYGDRGTRNPFQRGVACLEVIFVIPILFLMLLASVEFGQFIRIRQAALVLSREAALRASRECGGILSLRAGNWSKDDTERRTEACLRRIRDEITPQAVLSLNGVNFLFSSLKLIPTNDPAVNVPSHVEVGGEPLSISGGSIVWNQRVMMSEADFNVVQQTVLVQMQYQYRPVIVGTLAILGLGPIIGEGGMYNEVSIF